MTFLSRSKARRDSIQRVIEFLKDEKRPRTLEEAEADRYLINELTKKLRHYEYIIKQVKDETTIP